MKTFNLICNHKRNQNKFKEIIFGFFELYNNSLEVNLEKDDIYFKIIFEIFQKFKKSLFKSLNDWIKFFEKCVVVRSASLETQYSFFYLMRFFEISLNYLSLCYKSEEDFDYFLDYILKYYAKTKFYSSLIMEKLISLLIIKQKII